jgi:hypothetical protein
MKKKITTGPELLSHIAASGDAAAFYALVSPSLREYFFKLRSNGETIEESSEKIIECAISLFKKFQHTDPDDFEDWLKSELETFSGSINNDSEVVLDKQLFLQCDTVLADAQKQLLRTANTLRCGSRKRGVLAFPGRHKTIFTLVAASIIISVLFVVLFGFYGMRADISFSKNDLLFKKKNTVRDTTVSSVVSADSVKKSDSTISVAVPVTPVQEPKPVPPPPRPRPRVTHTPPPPPPPPAPANDLSESNQTSQPIPDQVPQTASSRPERTNQQPGYTSQSQTTESQPVSSYSSSGNTSPTTLQPSQQQSLTSQEQNQP